MMNSIISNSCVGWSAHQKLYPHQPYVNGFIASLLYDDEQFVELAENYKEIIARKTVMVPTAYEDLRFLSPVFERVGYPVTRFGPVDVSWIHAEASDAVIETFERRQARGEGIEPVFVWCTSEMFQGRKESLIRRFLSIPCKSVLVTDNPADADIPRDWVLSEDHRVAPINQVHVVDEVVAFARQSPWFAD